jgi:hypothetical protein
MTLPLISLLELKRKGEDGEEAVMRTELYEVSKREYVGEADLFERTENGCQKLLLAT